MDDAAIRKRLAEIGVELAELAKRLEPPPRNRRGKAMSARDVRAMIEARRLREDYFNADLFADPAWDLLLSLFASRLEDKEITVSHACMAAAVPSATAHRFITKLTTLGLAERYARPDDGRRVFVRLTPRAVGLMTDYCMALERRTA